jgi:DNA-binding CsgD family transcriptional regulator
MKLELFNEEANKIWRRHAPGSMPDLLQMELDLYKKLLNFFQVGDYYYYIFNFQTLEFDIVSESVETVLGYHPSEFSIDFFMKLIHPDDAPWLISFEDKTSSFFRQLPAEKIMRYKNRYDYRVKKKDGNYVRLLHQASIVQMDENGGLVRTLGVHTDISYLKRDGKPVMSLIGMDGEPSYLDIDVKNLFIESKEALSKREKEVLRLLIEGKVSKEIAEALNISKATVDTHRRNMLHRNKLINTGELVGKAIREGWL